MRRVTTLLCTAVLLLSAAVSARAQQTNDAPAMRIGLHGGVQTSLFRYSVFPYEGEFQSTVEQSTVAGITLGLPIDASFQLQVDIAWWSQPWSAFHDGDPKIEIERRNRALVEFPVLLQYRFITLPVPLYIAAGPVVSLVSDGEKSYSVSYTGFSEREGWRTSRRDYHEETLHLAVAGEVGIEMPFSASLSMQMAVRLTQPLGKSVSTQDFTLRELSVWRARIGFLYTL
ncbi:MAG: outer membrane beta-barrel protein [Bacteroidetes bacterium]|nr:outer membrane beta-barrel protein [Bacteroidota bacterium]